MALVTPDDLGVYLGVELTSDAEDRAQMLIDDAVVEALSVVTVGTIPDTGPTEDNLPNGAASVIRAAVARIFLNPSNTSQEALGPYSVGRSVGSGAMLSKAERAKLRRLAGGSSAFSIDQLPVGYPESVFPDSSSSS